MQCASDWLCKIANLIKDISQEKRLQILCMLSNVESMCVCEIIDKLGISQNLVSHHLKVLKDLGFLKTQREWKNIHYAINTKKYDQFKSDFKKIFNI